MTSEYHHILDELEVHIAHVLDMLGTSNMDSVSYDTAWIARLSLDYPNDGFDEALAWLRRNQHEDGSWGSSIMHYHDRIICTLGAILALYYAGTGRSDEMRIKRGEHFLWQQNGRLHFDASETIAYPVLALSLVQEALSLGLDIPHDLYRDVTSIEKKLNLLGRNPKLWRYSSMSFSLEAARAYFPAPQELDGRDFLEDNYSVGTSPAATAAYLIHLEREDPDALAYLQFVMAKQGDGGAPNVSPIDTFEAGWALNHLRLAGAVQPDQPEVKRVLDYLWSGWRPGQGMSFSSYYSVPDLDCTAVGFAALHWGGYPVNGDTFSNFEEEDHFFCFPGEIGLSMSVHVRTLSAMLMIADHPQFESWSHKITTVLRRQDVNGYFWFDKWHISPYYLTCEAIYSLRPADATMVDPRIKWILKTQHADGGWGYYGFSTPEETAYCLQALLYWDRLVERINPASIEAAAYFLLEHVNDEQFVPLWIGKCLYTPPYVVRAAILGALHSYKVYKED